MKHFMKLFSILLLLVVAACGERKLTGYVVCKKYIPKHMCCSEPNTVVKAVIMPPVHHHQHEVQDPRWLLYVSNSYGTTEIDVTKNCYNYFKVTDKVRVYGNYVELIKEGCR